MLLLLLLSMLLSQLKTLRLNEFYLIRYVFLTSIKNDRHYTYSICSSGEKFRRNCMNMPGKHIWKIGLICGGLLWGGYFS